MGLSALNTGLSGLNANQRALDVSANNVANASTAGFQPQQANFEESSPAGSGVTISAQAQSLSASDSQDSQPSGTDLAKETTDSLVYKAQFDLSAQVVKTADQNLGTLINTKA